MMGGTIGLHRLALAGLMTLLPWSAAKAETVTAAVAANFTEAAKDLATRFEKATGDKVVLAFGSSGQLYAQISQGAPFDVFLSADRERPQRAVANGFAVPGSAFTYATGRLVLFSVDKELVKGAETLTNGRFDKIAIANPATAPYGEAAVEALKALHAYEALSSKLVRGENITQTYQFVATGNAQLGFVALSQVARMAGGSRWIVPEDLYRPIAQDAVLLKHGERNNAARAFLTFLESPAARAVEERFGYGAGLH